MCQGIEPWWNMKQLHHLTKPRWKIQQTKNYTHNFSLDKAKEMLERLYWYFPQIYPRLKIEIPIQHEQKNDEIPT